MKTVIEGKGELRKLFLIGNSGRKYRIIQDGVDSCPGRMLFEQDLNDFIMDCIDKAATEQDIESHANSKYSVCGSGFMGWAVSYQKILHIEHAKNCEWLLGTIKTRVHKMIQSI